MFSISAPSVLGLDAPQLVWIQAEVPEDEKLVWDYVATGLTLCRHPLAIMQSTLGKLGCSMAMELHNRHNGSLAKACGIVTLRQQPETAHGVMFGSLEDETGNVQVIVWPKVKERLGLPLLRAQLLGVKGTWQREGGVRNLIAGHMEGLTPLLGGLAVGSSRDVRRCCDQFPRRRAHRLTADASSSLPVSYLVKWTV